MTWSECKKGTIKEAKKPFMLVKKLWYKNSDVRLLQCKIKLIILKNRVKIRKMQFFI